MPSPPRSGGMEAWRLAVLLAASLAAAGCIEAPGAQDAREADDPADAPAAPTAPCEAPTAPTGVPPQGPQQGAVSNQPGNFGYSGQMAARTGTESYAWENPSRGAQVAWAGQSSTGSFELVVYEACGNEVYRGSFGSTAQGGGYVPTAEGTGGTWLIVFDFRLFTGQMGLSVMSG